MSLRLKVGIIGLVPFILFLMVIAVPTWQSFQDMRYTEQLLFKVEAIEAASKVVQESQKERGKSVGYLKGGLTLSSVEEQRKLNDQGIAELREKLPLTDFPADYKAKLFKALENIEKIRPAVSSKKLQVPQVVKTYTQSIQTILDPLLFLANGTRFADLAADLRSLRILEDAKESGGLLRANMSAILSTNTPINNQTFTKIIDLEGGVAQGLLSNGLILDETEKQMVRDFKNSADWIWVQKVFQTILVKSNEGEFGYNPTNFFARISKALDRLTALISYQKKVLLKDIRGHRQEAIRNFYFMLLSSSLAALLVIGLVLYFSRNLVRVLGEVVVSLESDSSKVTEYSDQVMGNSTTLASAMVQEASSLQQSIAAVHEIEKMLAQTANMAKSSRQVSEESNRRVEEGKTSVERMIQSITDIKAANENVMKEVDQNQQQMNEITDLIGQIGDKTQIINDIVFQTKLLSFNASVEAARAGENGKGFAVVAEEVGNLASMSGQAASDITQMLESSIQRVQKIVTDRKDKMTHIVQVGNRQVQQGVEVAHQCGSALDKILGNVEEVNNAVQSIDQASKEQALAVKEVNQAFNVLSDITKSNELSSIKMREMAEKLSQRSVGLDGLVKQLNVVIKGDKKVA